MVRPVNESITSGYSNIYSQIKESSVDNIGGTFDKEDKIRRCDSKKDEYIQQHYPIPQNVNYVNHQRKGIQSYSKHYKRREVCKENDHGKSKGAHVDESQSKIPDKDVLRHDNIKSLGTQYSDGRYKFSEHDVTSAQTNKAVLTAKYNINNIISDNIIHNQQKKNLKETSTENDLAKKTPQVNICNYNTHSQSKELFKEMNDLDKKDNSLCESLDSRIIETEVQSLAALHTKSPSPEILSNIPSPRMSQITKLERSHASIRYKPYQKKSKSSIHYSSVVETQKKPAITRNEVLSRRQSKGGQSPYPSVSKAPKGDTSTTTPSSENKNFKYCAWLNKESSNKESSVDGECKLPDTFDEFVNKICIAKSKETLACTEEGYGEDVSTKRKRNKKKSHQTESRHDRVLTNSPEISIKDFLAIQNTTEADLIDELHGQESRKGYPFFSGIIKDGKKAGVSIGTSLYGYLTKAPSYATSAMLKATESLRGFSGKREKCTQQKDQESTSEKSTFNKNSDVLQYSPVFSKRSPPKTMTVPENSAFLDRRPRAKQVKSLKKILTPRGVSLSDAIEKKHPRSRYKHVSRSQSRDTNESQSLSDIVAELRQLSSEVDSVIKKEVTNTSLQGSSAEEKVGLKIKHGIAGILSEIDDPMKIYMVSNAEKINSYKSDRNTNKLLNYAFGKVTGTKAFVINTLNATKEFVKTRLDKTEPNERLNPSTNCLSYNKSTDKGDLPQISNTDGSNNPKPHKSGSYIQQLGIEDYLTCDEQGNPKKELFGVRRNCKKLYTSLKKARNTEQKVSTARILAPDSWLYRTLSETQNSEQKDSTTSMTVSDSYSQSSCKSYDDGMNDEHDFNDESDIFSESYCSEEPTGVCSSFNVSEPTKDSISYSYDLSEYLDNKSDDYRVNGIDKMKNYSQVNSSDTSLFTASSSSIDSKSRSLEDMCADFRLAANAIHDCIPNSKMRSLDTDFNHIMYNNGMNERSPEYVDV